MRNENNGYKKWRTHKLTEKCLYIHYIIDGEFHNNMAFDPYLYGMIYLTAGYPLAF